MSESKLREEQREFQTYARGWLAETAPPPPPERMPLTPSEVMTTGQRDYLQDWQRRCYEAGLIGADVPTAYGGGGHEGCQRIANQEMSRAGTPFPINVVGLNMAVPTILEHGTEAQQVLFVPGALSGEELWCQGFSEPGAGSDLASLKTIAEDKGGHFLVNGQKMWISNAGFCSLFIVFARIEDDKNITGFIVENNPENGITLGQEEHNHHWHQVY